MSSLRPVIYGRDHVISSGHALASQAGSEILRAGGNAIDAGVAAGIALGVLESELVGFAGVAPIMIYSAEADKVVTISGLGTWPASTRRSLFETDYKGAIPHGVLGTVVPAAPDAWITALAQYGTMSFAEVSAYAVDFARNGFHMYPLMADLIAKNEAAYASYPSNREIYLPQGRPPKPGELFVQRDLGDLIAYLADEDRAASKTGGRAAGLRAARDAFYKGEIARRIADFYREEGGFLTYEDMAGFSVEIEPALSVSFAGLEVHGCGPWCQGMMLLEILKLLDGIDLEGMGHNSVDYLHTLAEAIKLAAADREAYLGDPRFVDVPVAQLLSEEYAAERRAQIHARAAPDLPEPGNVRPFEGSGMSNPANLDTSYVCVVDRAGNAFSATPSDASQKSPVVPGLGVVISPRGHQSWVDPAHASSIAPGKRPRLTPNPALAIGRDRILPFGSPGGDVQTQAMLQSLLNHVVFGHDVQTAVELPRIASYSFPSSFEPHRSEPGLLRAEARIPEATLSALGDRGHRVEVWPEISWLAGSVSMIDADRGAGGTRRGAADPRRAAYAVGW